MQPANIRVFCSNNQRASPLSHSGLNPTEKRATLTLASLYSLRMLGLFMILPVFSLYAADLEGVTPLLIGIAIGIYGLTQALLQIPFGLWSDRIGRKPVIITGLAIFAVGSVVAATADSIVMVIVGRAIQGAGAIAAAIMALAADVTREEQRSKIMATIGISIGFAFVLSMILGPILNQWVGVPGIFWITALLALLGMVLVQLGLPKTVALRSHRDAGTRPSDISSLLKDGQLLRIDLSIFTLHFLLTACFVALPLMLRDGAGLEAAQHPWVYGPVLIIAMLLMVPFVIIAESRRKMKLVLLTAIMGIAVGLFIMALLPTSLWGIITGLFIFFLAFNVLEATLPSLIAKEAPADKKGTAMGVYSSAQFLGAFAGGLLGGWVMGQWGASAVFMVAAVLTVFWLLVMFSLRSPRYFSSRMIRVGVLSDRAAAELNERLLAVTGVKEAVVIVDDEVAYLKVDKDTLDEAALAMFRVEQSSLESAASTVASPVSVAR
ncbi:MAG: MFS transporter [Gammaproteobacteria bacterium]|nr:MAG: MFS transporter [Gammaproteobacteria bacterium]